MSDWTLLLPILIPIAGAVFIFLTPKKSSVIQRLLALLFSAGGLIAAIALFGGNYAFKAPWAGFGMNFELRLYNFSSFIMLAVGIATFLTVLYSTAFMREAKRLRQFFSFALLTSAFVTGAVLANNLVVMLFFWEGLLCMLFALIMTGGSAAAPTAVRALLISGAADFCLILGVAITAWLAGSLTMDQINLQLNTFWGGAAFVLMMIGAIGKAGAMPLHSWIPDAAKDTPLPFMAFIPAALDKLLGIYLLARLSLDLFQLQPGSGLSLTMMIIGAITILFAVLMALIQKDYKRLLSYHAVSQVGYMVLGIGTGLPVGIIGGLFHMVNHVMYKSALFFTAGAVEKQTGTTDIRKLGGLGRQMPVTCVTFVIAALSIAGAPPFNGFFSKELVFDAALEINVVFYIAALLGAFFTAASFLKLGHAVYFGKPTEEAKKAKEAPWPMLIPAALLALGCILFGVYNPLPLRGLIEPIVYSNLMQSLSRFTAVSYAGLPKNWLLVGISIVILGLAILNHIYGVRKSGKAQGASDHIHYAPVLKNVYDWAEAGLIDPYNIVRALIGYIATALFAIDRLIDRLYTGLAAGAASLISKGINKAHTGKHWMYVLWVLGGAAAVALIFVVVGG